METAKKWLHNAEYPTKDRRDTECGLKLENNRRKILILFSKFSPPYVCTATAFSEKKQLLSLAAGVVSFGEGSVAVVRQGIKGGHLPPSKRHFDRRMVSPEVAKIPDTASQNPRKHFVSASSLFFPGVVLLAAGVHPLPRAHPYLKPRGFLIVMTTHGGRRIGVSRKISRV